MSRITVTVRDTGGRLADASFSDAALMRRIGLTVRERIIRRTQSGRDAEGQPFTPYVPAYAQAKAEALGGSGTVNLEVSGRMLQGLTITTVTNDRVELGFKD